MTFFLLKSFKKQSQNDETSSLNLTFESNNFSFNFNKLSFLLGVFSVDCPIHPHCGLQMIQPAVGTDAVGEGCQGSGTETGRA